MAGKISPPLRSAPLGRERLLARLRSNADTRLTVVAAPVGWGKTSLLAAWAGDPLERRAVTWLTVDHTDDEPIRFWTYVIAALRTVDADLGTTALAALAVPGVDLVGVILPMLLNDLSGLASARILVIDDYHTLAERQIHETLEFFLAYLPPSLHLAVASRADPPLPLARLRARGELTELRAADLRLDIDEAAALVDATAGRRVERAAVAALLEHTEGWAAGVYLAALAARGRDDADDRLAHPGEDGRHLAGFLAAEVLDRLPPEAEDALVRLSILDQLTPPLCDAVLERRGCAQLLAELERSNQLVVPLAGSWVRLHHLLRDVLAQRLRLRADEATVAQLHRRAAGWFDEHGDDERAIRHLLAAGEAGAASQRLISGTPARLVGGPGGLATASQLGDLLPPELVDGDPRVAVHLAFVHGMSGRHSAARRLAERAGRSLERSGEDPPSPGWRSTVAACCACRVAFGYADTTEELLALAERAVDLETDPDLEGYGVARMGLAMALAAAGRYDDAAQVHAALRRGTAALDPVTRLIAAGLHATAALLSGDLQGAERLVVESWPAVTALEAQLGTAAAPATMSLNTVRGELARLRGDLQAAVSSLERAAELARVFQHPSGVVSALTALAGARIAAGDRPGARAALAEARDIVDDEVVVGSTLERLQETEAKASRGAARQARASGLLIEELTDRERAVLRALQGPLSLREIGAELYLSHNTVKGYAKSLYRKLGTGSRGDAVAAGRSLGLI